MKAENGKYEFLDKQENKHKNQIELFVFCSTLFNNQKTYFNIINHKIMAIFLNSNDN